MGLVSSHTYGLLYTVGYLSRIIELSGYSQYLFGSFAEQQISEIYS